MFERLIFLVLNIAWYFPIILSNKYCHICKSHTMCVYRRDIPSDNCLDYKKISLSIDNKTEILEAYNSLRNYVASGGFINETNSSFPESSKMNMLRWKEELSQIAQRWADQCPTEENDECRDIQDFRVGQNIFSLDIPSKDELPQFTQIFTKIWFEGLKQLSLKNLIEFDNSSSWKSKIFTQSIWGNAQYVGCGVSLFKKLQQDEESLVRTLLVVCNMAPEGNIPNSPAYQIGQPCSECPREQCHPKFNYLCNENETEILDASRKHTGKLFEHAIRPWDWKSKLTTRRVYSQRIPGVWYNGECRCNFIYRSKGNTYIETKLIYLGLFSLVKACSIKYNI
ncbi:venom allergen 3-like [Coccinella septempunctata]|uniref:venom allergen 3-like n=1 Tax=Coccinella septempunctata TaxID=41139 RepID=UPI001D072013|nr:venom allergen 3-like [Coccinella septempunctata]